MGLKNLCRTAAIRLSAAPHRYSRWLRTEYEFPIRVPVYLFPSKFVVAQKDSESRRRFSDPTIATSSRSSGSLQVTI